MKAAVIAVAKTTTSARETVGWALEVLCQPRRSIETVDLNFWLGLVLDQNLPQERRTNAKTQQ